MFVVGDMNPYQADAKSAELFSCGFLQLIAESLVDEVKQVHSAIGALHSGKDLLSRIKKNVEYILKLVKINLDLIKEGTY